jgi:hypothetical protein
VADQPNDPLPRVRLARITDLAALAEISRRAHRASHDEWAEMRSLGLPIGPPALNLYQLFRMPLSLVRSSDSIWVHQHGSALDGLARVERDPGGNWTIVELSAESDTARARLIARVVREAGRHGVVRVHVAYREDAATLALLGSSGFQAYARETLFMLQPPARGAALPRSDTLRPAVQSDALHIAQLMTRITPAAVARVELVDAIEWEHAAAGVWTPRASISPLLRLVEGRAYVSDGDAGNIHAWVHLGVARESGEQHPHVIRVSVLPGIDPAPLIAESLAKVAARAAHAGTGGSAILAVVRSYESGVGPALREYGFEEIADLRLAVRDARARVTAPGMVPAIG